MNAYRIKVELDVIAKDDETAIELAKNDINENDTEIQDIQIMWSEEYNQKGKIMSEEHKNCKYRFKGKSCEDCPLNCKLKRLQEENEELKKYQYTQEYLQSEIEKRQKALEEIRTFAKPIKENTCFGMYCGFVDWILETIDEVLK